MLLQEPHNRALHGGLGFSNCRLICSRGGGEQHGGNEGLRPKAARCGEVLHHFSCPLVVVGRGPGRSGSALHAVRGIMCGCVCVLIRDELRLGRVFMDAISAAEIRLAHSRYCNEWDRLMTVIHRNHSQSLSHAFL